MQAGLLCRRFFRSNGSRFPAIMKVSAMGQRTEAGGIVLATTQWVVVLTAIPNVVALAVMVTNWSENPDGSIKLTGKEYGYDVLAGTGYTDCPANVVLRAAGRSKAPLSSMATASRTTCSTLQGARAGRRSGI